MKMKFQCIKCGTVFKSDHPMCTSCSNVGAFLQQPSLVEVDRVIYHLEETLVHTKSTNEYQIKEIQLNGFITKVTRTLFPGAMGKVTYVSKGTLNEYTVKK